MDEFSFAEEYTHTIVSRFQKYSRSPVRKKKIHRQNKYIKLLPRSLEISNNKNPNEHFKKKKKKKKKRIKAQQKLIVFHPLLALDWSYG